MYFLGTIHPEIEETKQDNYKGIWLTLDEKQQVINDFYVDIDKKNIIPLTITHKSREELGSVILPKDRVGKVLDLLLDKDGNLIAKCKLNNRDSDVYKDFKYGKTQEERKWGLSLRIDATLLKGTASGGDAVIKRITHIAFTRTPYLSDGNTYVHHCAETEELIDKTISRHYYKENNGHCFISLHSPLKRKIMEIEKEEERIASLKKIEQEKSMFVCLFVCFFI